MNENFLVVGVMGLVKFSQGLRELVACWQIKDKLSVTKAGYWLVRNQNSRENPTGLTKHLVFQIV